jgi:hypothetical protein
MQPWYVATETFTPRHEGWATYIAWCGLTQLDEVVSLDPMLCPSLLPDIKAEYWPHIVNEDFMLNFFVDLEFLLGELPDGVERNLLCVFRNPVSEPPLPAASLNFEILGYDLVDVSSERQRAHQLRRVSGGLREFGAVVQRSADVLHARVGSAVGAPPEVPGTAARELSCLGDFSSTPRVMEVHVTLCRFWRPR